MILEASIKFTWLLAAVALAGWLITRRHKQARWFQIAELVAITGFIAPGETAVIVGGLVAGQGQISLFALIAIVWACAVLGDVTSYELGRRLGRQWLLRRGERLKITEERLDQVQHF